MTEELDQYQYLWDGTEDWVLLRRQKTETSLRIHFANSKPSVPEMLKVRSLVPKFQHMTPALVKNLLSNLHTLDIVSLTPEQARQIAERARGLGFRVEEIEVHRTILYPFDRTGKSSTIIDNDDEAERVVKKMIEAGVPIVEQRPQNF